MDRFRVTGGQRLAGEVRITGAKNSALKLMAAALLAEGVTVLEEAPRILDVEIMSELLRRLGCEVEGETTGTVRIDVPAAPRFEADYDLVRSMRASICVLGPLLARCGEVHVAYPGGDAIGSRGLDMHIEGLVKLGATVENSHGVLIAKAPNGLRGTTVWLDFPSVGATENILMAAVLARGRTVIDNAAREPEIVDLADCLAAMGARIDGAGTSRIVVEGVERLHGARHAVIADRIETGTFLVAGAITGGRVTATHARPDTLGAVLDKLREAGAEVIVDGDRITVDMHGQRPRAVDIVTEPHPGFPTDMQAQFMALNCVAEGTGTIDERIFENRFMHVNELMRLGADIHIDGHRATVRGVERLTGAPVMATDLRASASLILAGLVAEGETTIDRIYHLDRGYEHIERKLSGLGARIRRES